ncbi:hypothetical protein FRX31_003939 [Thalictrum thalictroides]|uniref:Transmembrane protein n=1 Tax=Thalictrum thalictroides TaxID=46969 RepID=A0A7J6XDP5_THATH|nr:hypothetical protein FRX31_003939 [Thalictrum thalictroides]
MKGRVFVLIFFCWAFLSIITPTLIFLSASAKANLDSKDQDGVGVRARRMLATHLERNSLDIATTVVAPAPSPGQEVQGRVSHIQRIVSWKEVIYKSIRRRL